MSKSILIFILFFIMPVLLAGESARQNADISSQLSGPYMGQPLAGAEATLFAPNIISSHMYTRDITMTPAMDEIYFCVSTLGYNLIFYSRIENGVWTQPEIAPFIEDLQYFYYEPHITPDGQHLLFLCDKPLAEGQPRNENIWVVDRENDGWGIPYNLGEPVCTEQAEFFPSTTRSGTLYFTRQEKDSRINHIYRARLVEGKYTEPERLGPQVNCGTNRFNAFVDPDEGYIIVPAVGMADSRGGTDYYIVFRNADDSWQEPVNMGDQVNSAGGREFSPYISPDGKYFFFMAVRTPQTDNLTVEKINYQQLLEWSKQPQNGNSDIYWISADFIEKLRP